MRYQVVFEDCKSSVCAAVQPRGVDDDEQVGGNTTEPSETIQMGELDQQPVHAASSAPDHRVSGSGRGGKPTAMQRNGQLQSNATWVKARLF